MARYSLLILLVFSSALLQGQSYTSGYSADTVSQDELNRKSAPELLTEANSNAAGSPLKSIQQAGKALEKSIESGDKRTQYQSYNTLGALYYNVGNFSAAAQYFRLASAGFAELKDAKSKALSDKYLAMSESRLKEIRTKIPDKKSKSSYKGDYKTGKFKSSKSDIYTDKIDLLGESRTVGEKTAEKDTLMNEVPELVSFSSSTPNKDIFVNSNNVSASYNSKGLFDKNITYQFSVLEEGKKRNAPGIVGAASFNLGNTYVEASEPIKAIPFLVQSISLAEKDKDIVQKQKSVKELARAYEKMGRYDKALEVIKNYIHTMDSIQGIQDRNLEANAELNAEFMKQEARIQKLIVSQKQKEADISRQRTIMWSLAGALGVFSLLTWLLVRNIRQKQKANMQIKLQSLRTQMNPHFIFNSLNSVNNFISKNDERSANRYLSDFSKLMRTVLKNSDQDFVTLDTEIQTLKIYLELEHFRFGEKFDYSLEVADDIDAEHVKVPPMLIQPYIENAIWHGLRYKDQKGLLEVKFYTENEQLFCTVRDNGIGREKSAELKTQHQKSYQSTGIQNTRERIELLNKMHGTKLQISIFDLSENGKPSGTMAKISIPYIMQFEEI